MSSSNCCCRRVGLGWNLVWGDLDWCVDFLCCPTVTALLLLLGWWAHGWELEKLLLGLLLLVGEQGNLLLKALHTGHHLLDRLHCRGELVVLLLILLELLPGRHVGLLVCFDGST